MSEVEELRERLRVAEFTAETYRRRAENLSGLLGSAGRRSEAVTRWNASRLLLAVATHTMTRYRREGWEQSIEYLWPQKWGTLAERFPDEVT